ncbi:hypothetical protein [uncultured Tateyamaria sp.]|uniref:hypothetical protein n=1 Tax=Tateyamaria sp. 1078 TaxID=3417464 RepID=UPI0026298EEA|nr:hypothetical protein [uncultured Tateyamaria sp.]
MLKDMKNTQSFTQNRIAALLEDLNALPAAARPGVALAIAAAMAEYAAYESAQTDEARQVARLILVAADLERLSSAFRGMDFPRA